MKHYGTEIIDDLIRAIKIRVAIEQCRRNIRRLNKKLKGDIVKIHEADTLPKIKLLFEDMISDCDIVRANYEKIISK